jgi:hypothetical protein
MGSSICVLSVRCLYTVSTLSVQRGEMALTFLRKDDVCGGYVVCRLGDGGFFSLLCVCCWCLYCNCVCGITCMNLEAGYSRKLLYGVHAVRRLSHTQHVLPNTPFLLQGYVRLAVLNLSCGVGDCYQRRSFIAVFLVHFECSSSSHINITRPSCQQDRSKQAIAAVARGFGDKTAHIR